MGTTALPGTGKQLRHTRWQAASNSNFFSRMPLKLKIFCARKLRRVPGRPRDPKFVVVRAHSCASSVPEQRSVDAPGKGRGAEWQSGGAGLTLQIEQSMASAPKFELAIEVHSRPSSDESVFIGSARLHGDTLDQIGRQWVELTEEQSGPAGLLEIEAAWQLDENKTNEASDFSYSNASFESIDEIPTPAQAAIIAGPAKFQPTQLSMSASISQHSSVERTMETSEAKVLFQLESEIASLSTSSVSAMEEDVAFDETVASALTSDAENTSQFTSLVKQTQSNQISTPPQKDTELKHCRSDRGFESHEVCMETVLSQTAPSTYEDEVFEDAEADVPAHDGQLSVHQLPTKLDCRTKQHSITKGSTIDGAGEGARARSLYVTVFQARSLRRVRGHPWDPKFALLRLPYASTSGHVNQRTIDVSGKGTKAVWPGGAEMALSIKNEDSLTANFEAVLEVRCRPSSTAAELNTTEAETVLIGSARLCHGELGSLDRAGAHWVLLETNNGDEAGRVEIAVRWANGSSPPALRNADHSDAMAALASESALSSPPAPQVSSPTVQPAHALAPQQSKQLPQSSTPELQSSSVSESTPGIPVQRSTSTSTMSPASRGTSASHALIPAPVETTCGMQTTRFRARSVSSINDSSQDEEAVEEVLRCVDWRALLRDQVAAGHSQPMVDWSANVTGGAARPNAAGYCASGPLLGAKLGRGKRPPAFSFSRARRTGQRFMPKNEVEQLLQRRRQKQRTTDSIPITAGELGPESAQHGTIGDNGVLSCYPNSSSVSFGRMQANRFAGGPLADKMQSKRNMEAWRRRVPWAKDGPRLPTVRHTSNSMHKIPILVPASDDTSFARVRAPTESHPLSTVRTCMPARFAKSTRFANDSVPVRLRAAVRAAAKDRVRRARGGSSATPDTMPDPVNYAPHTSLSAGELVVTVEHCHNCEHAHGMTTQHCSARYMKAAKAMTDIVEQECVRQGKALVRVLLIPAPLEVAKGRLGALEVQATIMRSSGVPYSVVLHSKLATGRWPSREKVTRRLQQFLNECSE